MRKERKNLQRKYWLIKTEPETFSIDDLKRDKSTLWEGVRNYQARNYMRDAMKMGDLALFYHSSTEIPGVYGIARVSSEALPDESQFNPQSKYYDKKASKDKPIWMLRRFLFVKKLKNPVTLQQIKKSKSLSGILVAKRGMRLSIQPVDKTHFERILKLGN